MSDAKRIAKKLAKRLRDRGITATVAYAPPTSEIAWLWASLGPRAQGLAAFKIDASTGSQMAADLLDRLQHHVSVAGGLWGLLDAARSLWSTSTDQARDAYCSALQAACSDFARQAGTEQQQTLETFRDAWTAAMAGAQPSHIVCVSADEKTTSGETSDTSTQAPTPRPAETCAACADWTAQAGDSGRCSRFRTETHARESCANWAGTPQAAEPPEVAAISAALRTARTLDGVEAAAIDAEPFSVVVPPATWLKLIRALHSGKPAPPDVPADPWERMRRAVEPAESKGPAKLCDAPADAVAVTTGFDVKCAHEPVEALRRWWAGLDPEHRAAFAESLEDVPFAPTDTTIVAGLNSLIARVPCGAWFTTGGDVFVCEHDHGHAGLHVGAGQQPESSAQWEHGPSDHSANPPAVVVERIAELARKAPPHPNAPEWREGPIESVTEDGSTRVHEDWRGNLPPVTRSLVKAAARVLEANDNVDSALDSETIADWLGDALSQLRRAHGVFTLHEAASSGAPAPEEKLRFAPTHDAFERGYGPSLRKLLETQGHIQGTIERKAERQWSMLDTISDTLSDLAQSLALPETLDKLARLPRLERVTVTVEPGRRHILAIGDEQQCRHVDALLDVMRRLAANFGHGDVVVGSAEPLGTPEAPATPEVLK